MGAPLNNQFWKLRSKHGRDRLFETPELMWGAACEYFQWCEEHPFYKNEAKTVNIGDYQSEIQIAKIPQSRPFTLTGLCLYLDCSASYFREFKTHCSKDFLTVVTRIEETIYTQKFEGAASGFFNANIIARDLGLADKQHLEHASDPKAPLEIKIVSTGIRLAGNESDIEP